MRIYNFIKNNSVLFIVPTLAFILLLFATRFFIGITPDSMMYISASKSLIDTGELRSIYDGLPLQYMTHYPPGLPIFISAFSYITNNLYDAARLINALSLFAFIYSVGFVSKKYLSTTYIVILQLLLTLNLSLFTIYEMLWTEPLYIYLSFIAIYTLYKFANNKNIRWLIASAIIMSVSMLVRYSAASLIIASAIYLFIVLRKESLFIRVKYTFIHGAIASSSFVYWTIRNIILVDNPTDRSFAFHPMPLSYYQDLLTTTTTNFIGLSIIDLGYIASYIIGVIILLSIAYYSYNILKSKTADIKFILILFPLVFLVFLAISNTFFDFTPLYFRILVPVYILITISIFYSIFGNSNFNKKYKIAIIVIAFILFGGKFVPHIINISEGKELSSSKLMNSDLKAEVSAVDDNIKIYSNEIDRLYLINDGRKGDWLRNIDNNTDNEFLIMYFYIGRNYSSEIFDRYNYTRELISKSQDVIIYKYKLME